MNEPTQSVMRELRATLWRRVGDATIMNVDALVGVVAGLAQTPWDVHLVERGRDLAHAIAGSAGVYGFTAEARAASELEELLRAWPGASGIEQTKPLLDVLERGFEVVD